MSLLWFVLIIYCGFNGAEITDLNLLMVAVFYIGDCILLKTVREEKDNE